MHGLSHHGRAIFRILALCSVTALFYLLWIMVSPLLLASVRASYAWRNFNFRRWAKVTAVIMGMKISVKGTQPQSPFFLVANHLSYVDILAFASQVDCLFVAKHDVARWPILGHLCRSMGTIFVDRTLRKDALRVNDIMESALAGGKAVLLFPEGTSSAGNTVLPFHSALLEPAVRASYPVSYAAVSYRTPPDQAPASLAVCWWGDMTFLSHFYRLLHLKTFDAHVVFGSHSIRADDRKTLARRLWQAIQEEFGYLGMIEEQCKTTTR
jgi:1-acyl-sn-glycerol-3-phosphate acyltransferase